MLADNFYTRKLAQGGAVLAPMAGFTDAPFRLLCREFGSAWAVTEMVSAKALVMGDLQGIEIGEPYVNEPDLVIQVFGGEPEIVADGARILFERYQPQALDLNMGCPVKKVTGKSCGSKLMLDPQRAAEIIAAMVKSVPVPVSAKLRLGYDRHNVTEVALALQEAGVSLIAVHGRTAAQKYSGDADWDSIMRLQAQLRIPVVGSGDVASKAQYDTYRQHNLGIMIARAALGRPWLFAEVTGNPVPDVRTRLATAYRHAVLHCNWYDARTLERENHAIKSLRSQFIAYFKPFGRRADAVKLGSLQDLRTLISSIESIDFSALETRQLSRTLTRVRGRKAA